MTAVELAAIAVALGADAFAVSVGVGARYHDWGATARLAAAFGSSQLVMAALGWTVGAVVLPYVEAFDHWVVFGVLSAIALKMLWESFREDGERSLRRGDPTRGWLLVALALAVSLDSLAVGFTLGQMDARRWLYALVIGLTSSAMTAGGVLLARHGARRLGEWAERAGTLLLLAVAIKLLLG